MNKVEINKTHSDWLLLPELIKKDILKIEIKQGKPKYLVSAYNYFIVETHGFGLVTNKYRDLKSHLFGCYC